MGATMNGRFSSGRTIVATVAMWCWPAHAITLDWVAPAECPPASAVLHELEAQLQPDVSLVTS
jgi:hypothetical protein